MLRSANSARRLATSPFVRSLPRCVYRCCDDALLRPTRSSSNTLSGIFVVTSLSGHNAAYNVA
eukprot:330055-Prymnesium_polylepis.1